MKNTRNRILETSLMLFNEKGLSSISLRSIADEMKISVGNLQYHFKKREEIISELYFLLVKRMDNLIMTNDTKTRSLMSTFFDISRAVSSIFFDYRFFFLDFNKIIREHTLVREHYRRLTLQRQEQFVDFISKMQDENLMRDEMIVNEYENLFIRFQIISDFWISAANIQASKISDQVVLQYFEIICQTIFPYLTKKGKEEYIRLYNEA